MLEASVAHHRGVAGCLRRRQGRLRRGLPCPRGAVRAPPDRPRPPRRQVEVPGLGTVTGDGRRSSRCRRRRGPPTNLPPAGGRARRGATAPPCRARSQPAAAAAPTGVRSAGRGHDRRSRQRSTPGRSAAPCSPTRGHGDPDRAVRRRPDPLPDADARGVGRPGHPGQEERRRRHLAERGTGDRRRAHPASRHRAAHLPRRRGRTHGRRRRPGCGQLNPSLVYHNGVGYGVDGPYTRRAALAPTIAAGSGFARGQGAAGPRGSTSPWTRSRTPPSPCGGVQPGNPDGIQRSRAWPSACSSVCTPATAAPAARRR